MPITVCLWDPVVPTRSATSVVLMGGRRLFRLSGSGEGEVSCSYAVRLKRTSKKKKSKASVFDIAKHKILTACLALFKLKMLQLRAMHAEFCTEMLVLGLTTGD